MALKKVSQEGLEIDENTQRLYWNGKAIVTHSKFILGEPEYLLGKIAVTAAGVTAFVSVVRLLVVDLKWLKILVAS